MFKSRETKEKEEDLYEFEQFGTMEDFKDK